MPNENATANSAVFEERVRRNVDLYRHLYKTDPKFVLLCFERSDVEGLDNLVPHMRQYLNISSHRSNTLWNEEYYNFEIGDAVVPAAFAHRFMGSNFMSIIDYEFYKENKCVKSVGFCTLDIEENILIGKRIVFNDLVISHSLRTKEMMDLLMLTMYVEVLCMSSERFVPSEIIMTFPMLNKEDNKVEMLTSHPQLNNLITTFIYLSRHTQREDVIDRFTEENPHNIKMMRLLPTDAFTVPEKTLELIVDCQKYFRRETQLSRDLKRVKEGDDNIMMVARKRFFNNLLSQHLNMLLFFEDNEKEPFGFMEYTTVPGDPIHISGLYIDEKNRGKGYATWIMRQFLSEMFLVPQCKPMCLLEIFANHAVPLLKFYGKFGFQPYAQDIVKRLTKKELKAALAFESTTTPPTIVQK